MNTGLACGARGQCAQRRRDAPSRVLHRGRMAPWLSGCGGGVARCSADLAAQREILATACTLCVMMRADASPPLRAHRPRSAELSRPENAGLAPTVKALEAVRACAVAACEPYVAPYALSRCRALSVAAVRP
jgi:hypothetical protein